MGRVVDPELEKQYDAMMQSLLAGQAQLAAPPPESKVIPSQPTELVPGTNVEYGDPRVKQAIAAGYSPEEIAAWLNGKK